MNTEKKEYNTPELSSLGKVEDITQGSMSGSFFDGTFSFGDPVPPGGILMS